MTQPRHEPPTAGTENAPAPGRLLAVHLGHSANCSSVGSVVDILFVSGAASAAILAALMVGLRGAAGSDTGAADGDPANVEADSAKSTAKDTRSAR